MIFSFLSFLVAVPSAIKVFNWTATLYKGSISFEAPMLYCAGVRLPVHGRRADRPVPGLPRHGHARPRHLLRHRPLPLHHGRRHGHGLHGGPALLVAEDHRPHVLGVVVEAGGDHHLRRLLPDVPAAVRRGLRRHAAALPPLPAGVPGLERDVVGRRLDPGGRLRSAAVLPAVLRCATARRPARIRGGRPAWNGRRRRRRRKDNFEETPVVVRGPYEYHLEKAQNEP